MFPHAPPRAGPVEFFEVQPCTVIPRRSAYPLTAALNPGRISTLGTLRLRRIKVSHSPRFRASRQLQTKEAAFATGVPRSLRISPLHMNSTPLPSALKFDGFKAGLWLSPQPLLQTYQTRPALALRQ